MILSSFQQLLPIFFAAAAGYFYAHRFSVDVSSLVTIISDILLPALIFSSVSNTALNAAELGEVIKVSTTFFALLLLVGWFWARLTKTEIRSALPALVFMNSGFLGIPLMQLWGGAEAMQIIVIFDQIQGFYLFTAGVFIITGGFSKDGLLSLVKSPIIWAIIIGFAFHISGLSLPASVNNSLSFLGNAASPLASFALGASIKETKFLFCKSLIPSLLFRYVISYLIALFTLNLFGVTGLARTVILVASTLPSAMFTSILPLRYGLDNRYASTMVVLTSVLCIFTIPLTLALPW